MVPVLALLMLGSMTAGQLATPKPQPEEHADARLVSDGSGAAPRTLSALPVVPRGKSTVIGGVIHNVDPVRDQLTLKIYGAKPMKILFDERTQVFRDGNKVSLRDIHIDDRAAIETVLDGTKIFAISVHMLSKAPLGECQGQILSYNPSTAELVLSDSLSSKSINLRIPSGTAIVPAGQSAHSSSVSDASVLVKGTLISVKFESDMKGQGIAREIDVLATPGSPFDFTGTISHIDMHSGILAVTTSNADSSYKISFDRARFPQTRDLHDGSNVNITAVFDGTHYVATKIEVE
ncbi:MAG: hypothetical protein JO347_07070 [Candidatus Eremiobacteraeota bacterium]|nr:hypothetical protein [Candidatus Eremiobacteraeota bacterium]